MAIISANEIRTFFLSMNENEIYSIILFRNGTENSNTRSSSSTNWKIVSNDGLILSCWTSAIIRGCILCIPILTTHGWPQIECVFYGLCIPLILLVDFHKILWQSCKKSGFLFWIPHRQSGRRPVSVYLTSASRPLTTSMTHMEAIVTSPK